MKTNLLPSWPYYAPDEVAAVSKVLQSGKVNYWTGEEGKLFEQDYAKFLGVPYCIALANGTLALELALHAFAIGPGDEVIVPAKTFIASASCVVARGAIPVVADVDLTSQNLTAETIAPKITSKTKAIIAVHLGGFPCDMIPIMDLAKKHNLKVIEDCAQAHGACYHGKPIGSFGDAAAFSFCQDKIITTCGEGGLLVLHDETLWKKAWAYKDHGKNYDSVYAPKASNGFKWLHDSFGSNWRLTEMQSAIGRLQLQKLTSWVEKRRENSAILQSYCKNIPSLRVVTPKEDFFHSYYRYYVFVRPEMLRSDWSRDRIIEEINKSGVPCFSGSCSEIYLEKAFVNAGFAPKERLPNAKILSETTLAFLVHPTVTSDNMHFMGSVIKNVMGEATS